jgi:hypothetical protein
MPILGHPIARPELDRPELMDDALETNSERLRDHLFRPHAGRREQLIGVATYAVNLTDPSERATPVMSGYPFHVS